MTQRPYGQDPDQPPSDPYVQPERYRAPRPAKKSRTALIVGVLLAALLIAGVAISALLPSDPGGDTDNKAGPSTSEPADHLLQGTGYSYRLPEGWEKVADQTAREFDEHVDTLAVRAEKLQGGRASVVVFTSPKDQSEWEAGYKKFVSDMTSVGTTAEEIDAASFDGKGGMGPRVRPFTEKGLEGVETTYLVAREGTLYTIVLFSKAGDDDAEADFQAIRDSWTWK